MLYLSKNVADHLSYDLLNKLCHLSIERQTLFECLYYRFSLQSRENMALLYMIYEGVKATDLVQ